MQVKDIIEEVKEVTGTCDSEVNFTAITRAVEMLANQGLFDPLIGTIDFTVNGAYYISLPRDVKTPIRLNINNNPAVARNRIYEFTSNTPGTNEGEEIGWQWHERGYSPVQDERKFPSKLTYVVTASGDIGKTLVIKGIDPNGYERVETMVGAMASPAETTYSYSEVRSIVRQETSAEATLNAEGGLVSRFYGDETVPEYRVIKLSQTGVGVRMIYRKHVFKITSEEDIIPLHSAMAILRAVDAVRMMQQRRYDDAAAAITVATALIKQEQDSRDEGEAVSSKLDIQTAINTNMHASNLVIAADVYDDASDIFGPVGRAKLFDRMTDAVQLLSSKSAWDSMTATVTLTSDSAGIAILPRDVHAPMAITINNNPSFARSRLFEYSMNTNGHESGEAVGFAWSLDGETPFLVEQAAASAMTVAGDAADNTLRLSFYGRDGSGIEISEDILIGTTGAKSFARVNRVVKPVTSKPVTVSAGATLLARYYPDETEPLYRKIRVTKPSATLRVLFKKRGPHITSLNDFIPLRSRMAVTMAMRAVKALQENNPQGSELLMASAVKMLEEEMATSITPLTDQVLTAINANITTNDVLIVADVYDMASEIFGPIGRAKLFDRMTDAINILSNKSQWDSLLGSVDIMRGLNFADPANPTKAEKRNSYFVLPRYVQAVMAVNLCRMPTIARNRWFEFHLNGAGSSEFIGCGAWDDAGDTCLVNQLPRTKCGRDVIPVSLVATPDDSADTGASIMAYGLERDAHGRDIEVWRNGAPGCLIPCSAARPPGGLPKFVRVDRIVRAATVGFVRLYAYPTPDDGPLLLGFWYPDETEPRYRMIRVNGYPSMARVRYRKRTNKISSLYDVIQLRSRVALESMFRALSIQPTNPAAAVAYEEMAIRYLEEEQMASNPIQQGSLQFDPGTCPGFNDNIQ